MGNQIFCCVTKPRKNIHDEHYKIDIYSGGFILTPTQGSVEKSIFLPKSAMVSASISNVRVDGAYGSYVNDVTFLDDCVLSGFSTRFKPALQVDELGAMFL